MHQVMDPLGDIDAKYFRHDLDIMTELELAAALDVQVSTLASWRAEGKGPAYTKPAKTVYYRPADVRIWLGDHVRQPSQGESYGEQAQVTSGIQGCPGQDRSERGRLVQGCGSYPG